MVAIPAYKIPESVLVVIYTLQLEVLLIKRADHLNFWQSVTGSKDSENESLLETAVREVEEETGIDALSGQMRDWGLSNVYDIYPQWLHRYPPGVTRNIEQVFGLCLAKRHPVSLSPREHTASLWLTYQDAAAKCFSPSNAEAILLLPRFLDPAAGQVC